MAGRAAAAAIRAGDASAGTAYRREARRLLGRHFRHTALTARLCRSGRILDLGIQASARDQRVFDDLVEIGLANGSVTAGLVRGLLRR
jgi:hypothetical protein